MSQKVSRTDFLDRKWDISELITSFTLLSYAVGFHLAFC